MKHFLFLFYVLSIASVCYADEDSAIESNGHQVTGRSDIDFKAIEKEMAKNRKKWQPDTIVGARIDAKAKQIVIKLRISDCNSRFGMLKHLFSGKTSKATFGPYHYALLFGSNSMNCPLPKPRTVEVSVDIPQDRSEGDQIDIHVLNKQVSFTLQKPLEDEVLALGKNKKPNSQVFAPDDKQVSSGSEGAR
jgi:hypothetical protein